MGTITMELLSDALPGSGEGLAGIIDLDITHDERGLPYIPARRLKGLLLESARHLQDAGAIQRDPTTLFGKPGQQTGAPLHIGNGCVDGKNQYEALLNRFGAATAASPLSPTAVLNYFTYLRSRTSIDKDTGAAQEDTLRTVRVLRKTLPRTTKPLPEETVKSLAFLFDVDSPPEWEDDLATICKVTRNFGVSRSRGLGSIRCTYTKRESYIIPVNSGTETLPSDGRVTISFAVRNTDPLMITNRAGTHQSSESFIPGATILGTLASRHIAAQKAGFVPHTDGTFQHLFLDGTVTFSDLTIADPSGSHRSIPSPASVQREKDTENYYDLADEDIDHEVRKQKTRLKGGIGDAVTGSGERPETGRPILTRVPVPKDVFYHHRRPKDASIGHADEKNGGVFYQYEAIQAGQLFSGCISGPANLVAILYSLLAADSELHVGKSRTVQYGILRIQWITAEKAGLIWEPDMRDPIDAGSLLLTPEDDPSPLWKKGKSLYVMALSDIVLRNSAGLLEASPQNLADAIVHSLPDGASIELREEEPAFFHAALLGGFSGVWRLPRQQCLALERGSVIVLINDSGTDIDFHPLAGQNYGERTAEGFGRLLFSLDTWKKPEVVSPHKSTTECEFVANSNPLALNMARWIHLQDLHLHLAEKAAKQVQSLDKEVPSSFLSRLEVIVLDASSYSDLVSKLQNFKTPSQNNLKKLKDIFPFLAKPVEEITPEEISAWFKTIMNSVSLINKTNSWSEIVNGTDQQTDEQLFPLCQFYISSLLRALSVKQRNKTNNSTPQQGGHRG